jgi:hypothetical protein
MDLWRSDQFGSMHDTYPIWFTIEGAFLSTPKVIERLRNEFGTNHILGLKISDAHLQDKRYLWNFRYVNGDILDSIQRR